jgi:hypothetical protein
VAKKKLTDSEAKAILKEWPARTKKLWTVPGKHGFWMRGQPKDGQAVGPHLAAPGTKSFKTQPDGLWVYFQGIECCDVIVVEVCGTAQNLNDKRSRYIPASHSLILNCNKGWLNEKIPVQSGGSKARWEAAVSLFKSEPTEDIAVPVRHLRVIYVLPQELYDAWCSEHTPAGHEFFCSHASLDSYTSPKMQAFLRQMSPFARFYTSPQAKN